MILSPLDKMASRILVASSSSAKKKVSRSAGHNHDKAVQAIKSRKQHPELTKDGAVKVKHTAANDYIMREGIVLPVPIEEEEVIERQIEKNKTTKQKANEERVAKLAMLKEEIAHPEDYIYDPEANYYENMPIRDDLQVIGGRFSFS